MAKEKVKLHKSVTVISKSPAKYRITKYNKKGEIVKVGWAPSGHRANEVASELGGKIIHENQ